MTTTILGQNYSPSMTHEECTVTDLFNAPNRFLLFSRVHLFLALFPVKTFLHTSKHFSIIIDISVLLIIHSPTVLAFYFLQYLIYIYLWKNLKHFPLMNMHFMVHLSQFFKVWIIPFCWTCGYYTLLLREWIM